MFGLKDQAFERSRDGIVYSGQGGTWTKMYSKSLQRQTAEIRLCKDNLRQITLNGSNALENLFGLPFIHNKRSCVSASLGRGMQLTPTHCNPPRDLLSEGLVLRP
jgi:hypothetical protein